MFSGEKDGFLLTNKKRSHALQEVGGSAGPATAHPLQHVTRGASRGRTKRLRVTRARMRLEGPAYVAKAHRGPAITAWHCVGRLGKAYGGRWLLSVLRIMYPKGEA